MIKLILKKHAIWSVLVCQQYLLVTAFYCSFFLPAFEQTLALFNLQYFIFSSGKTLPVSQHIALPLPWDPPALATAALPHAPSSLVRSFHSMLFLFLSNPCLSRVTAILQSLIPPDTGVISPAQHWCSKNEPRH